MKDGCHEGWQFSRNGPDESSVMHRLIGWWGEGEREEREKDGDENDPAGI